MFSRLFILCGILMLLSACASTGTETPDAAGASAPSTGDGSVAGESTEMQAIEEALGEDLGEVDAPTHRAHRVVAGGQDPNELICKREAQTGSKFTVRTCMTRAEIDERAKNDQEIMDVYQRKRACAGMRHGTIPMGC